MNNNGSILKVADLSKRIGNKTILEGISFTVQAGDVVGIIGPNGSGKSTLLKIILNLVAASSGTVFISGGLKTTAMLEKPGFYPEFSVEKNFKIFLAFENFGKKKDEILNLFELSDYKNKRFSKFSTGMKKRCELAAALSMKPDLLILDEPTNGLDPQGIIEFRALLADAHKAGTTIIMTSHILSELERLCNQLMFINAGRLKEYSTKESLLLRFSNLEEAYSFFNSAKQNS